MWSICRCMWSLVLLCLALVLRDRSDCLTACPSPGQEGRMAQYQDPTYDPVTSHDLPNLGCHTTRIPHHSWAQRVVAQLVPSAEHVDKLQRVSQRPPRRSLLVGPAQIHCGQGSRTQTRCLCWQSAIIWSRATSEPGRGKPGMLSRWNHLKLAVFTATALRDRLRKRDTVGRYLSDVDYGTLGSSVPLALHNVHAVFRRLQCPPGMTITSADSNKQTWAVPGGVRDPTCGDGLHGPKRDNGPATKANVSFHRAAAFVRCVRREGEGRERKKKKGNATARAEHRTKVPVRAPLLGHTERPCSAAVDNSVARARHGSMSRTKTQ